MSTTREVVLAALVAKLATITGAPVVERNLGHPDTVPAAGLIVVEDGDTGEPDYILGGPNGTIHEWRHAVPVKLFVQKGDDAQRRAAFDDLLAKVNGKLLADRSLGGAVDFMDWLPPSDIADAVEKGSTTIRSGTVLVTVQYDTDSPAG